MFTSLSSRAMSSPPMRRASKIESGLTVNRLFQGRDRYQSTHPNRFADLGLEHLGMGCVLPPDMLEDSLQLSSTDDLLCRYPLPPTSDTPAPPAVDQASPTDVASLLDMSLTEAKRRAASDFERRYLVRVMDLARGSVSEGARRSGLDRTNFRRLLQRHGLRRTL
jgi:DNA-binding protein Fis